tara:strand:+ start:406 stop:576 length:171 start_codon:yes stop_codon:yes gene_type:complete
LLLAVALERLVHCLRQLMVLLTYGSGLEFGRLVLGSGFMAGEGRFVQRSQFLASRY